MADFRELALKFVLEDDETKLTTIAQSAAQAIQDATPNTNAVALWVEAVQPWMPNDNEDEVMYDSQEPTPDWTTRAKGALEFLSRTLEFMKLDALKPSQVKLLVTFFGAMFDVDHKAGIKASASALFRIIQMHSYRPSSGLDIIPKVCALGEDFPRQVPATRLAVYELLRALIDGLLNQSLQRREQGEDLIWIKDALQLCQKERDPDCLIVWFDTLRIFLEKSDPAQAVLEDVYEAFRAYFPITLPRTSQSNLTPEELKDQLRKCFSANHRLAPLVFPFLLGKMDQGEGLTANVKIDITRTLKACIEKYSDPKQSLSPFVNKIWSSLKYEVRNGDVEDVTWASLEVFKAITQRLEQDELRDYALTVTRDCVDDLSNKTYTAAAGRLLMSVMSASPAAFARMAAPVLSHLKENLRHPISATHGQELFRILHVLLEARLLLSKDTTSDQHRHDFAPIDATFKGLYFDILRTPVLRGSESDASDDEIRSAIEAMKGIGALVCQHDPLSLVPSDLQTRANRGLLLPEEVRIEIRDALYHIISHFDHKPRGQKFYDLVNQSILALHRLVQADPNQFLPLLRCGIDTMRQRYLGSDATIASIQDICSTLAFVGCNDLQQPSINGSRNFFSLVSLIASELLAAIDAKASPWIWCALAGGLHAAALFFTNASADLRCNDAPITISDSWLSELLAKYPGLDRISAGVCYEPRDDESITLEVDDDGTQATATLGTGRNLHRDGLLVILYICRLLCRRATTPTTRDEICKAPSLMLAADFAQLYLSDHRLHTYLHRVSELFNLVVLEAARSHMIIPHLENLFFTLFRDEAIIVPSSTHESTMSEKLGNLGEDYWDWLILSPLNVLAFGCLQSLQPQGVSQLFVKGVAQQIMLRGPSAIPVQQDPSILPVLRVILVCLANKQDLAAHESLLRHIEHQLENCIKQACSNTNLAMRESGIEQALTIMALSGGLVRRCKGEQTRRLFSLLREVPNDVSSGYRLGVGMEVIVAPQRYLRREGGGVERLLWKQKVYVELVRPMIDMAASSPSSSQSPTTRTNFATAVMRMVRHMNTSIFEDDSSRIARIAISVIQAKGTGTDAEAALEVLRSLMINAPEHVQDHIQSLIASCISLLAHRTISTSNLSGQSIQKRDTETDLQKRCSKLALEVLGGLPRAFEPRLWLVLAPKVRRQLSLANGHPVREVRQTARLARAAWAEPDA